MRSIKHFQRLLGIAALSVSALFARAENYSFTLLVNGVSYVFNLAEKPVITYQDDILTVKVTEPSAIAEQRSTVSEISVAVAEVQSIDLQNVDGSTGIRDASPNAPATQFVDGLLQLSGLPTGSQVSVVNLGGKTCLSVNASAEGKAAVGLHSLPVGVYLVRTAKSSIKVTNK